MPIMADFARMPNQRKVLVFVVAGLMLGLLYWQFVFKKLKADLDEAEVQHNTKVALDHKLDNDIKDFADLKPTMAKLQIEIAQNEKALPTEAELPAFFDTLNRKITESGVQVNRFQQKPEEPVDAFVRVPVEFEIQGSFMQIKRFFSSLVAHKQHAGDAAPAGPNGEPVEERERIVSIENLTIGDPQVKNHEIVLTAKFTAMTFRQEEKATPQAPAKAATPTAGAGSAAKPLPPAATPAGAKARVNDAMDKSEQRSNGSAQRLKGGI
jgi:Tfp pilus assembly protein PilO